MDYLWEDLTKDARLWHYFQFTIRKSVLGHHTDSCIKLPSYSGLSLANMVGTLYILFSSYQNTYLLTLSPLGFVVFWLSGTAVAVIYDSRTSHIIKMFWFLSSPGPVPTKLSLVIFQNNLKLLLALPFNTIINKPFGINDWSIIREDSIPPLLILLSTISVFKPMFQPTSHCFQNIPCTFPPLDLCPFNTSCLKHHPSSHVLNASLLQFHIF